MILPKILLSAALTATIFMVGLLAFFWMIWSPEGMIFAGLGLLINLYYTNAAIQNLVAALYNQWGIK